MAIPVYKYIPEERAFTIGGRWKGSFDFIGTIRQILVMPQSPDTIYDIGIKDESGMLIFVEYDQTGALVSEDLETILFPGEKSIIIENATRDEEFRLKIIYQD